MLDIVDQPISLEGLVGEEEDSYLEDFIEDKRIASPEEEPTHSCHGIRAIFPTAPGWDEREPVNHECRAIAAFPLTARYTDRGHNSVIEQ
jgi:hypothetical protein